MRRAFRVLVSSAQPLLGPINDKYQPPGLESEVRLVARSRLDLVEDGYPAEWAR